MFQKKKKRFSLNFKPSGGSSQKIFGFAYFLISGRFRENLAKYRVDVPFERDDACPVSTPETVYFVGTDPRVI